MRLICLAAVVALCAGCQPEAETPVVAAAPAVEAPAPADPEAGLPAETRQRIDDLSAIAKAVEAYKAAKGTYPSSGNGWAAYKMSWGQSKGETWIPELVPDFLPAVPREPTKSEDPDGPQYLYASDGQYFKVIAHYTSDCEAAIKSPRVKADPVRNTSEKGCWAYGIWSDNGRDF
jgi:hypothetical protein